MAETSLMPGQVKIKVIGLGGGGCNSITRMVREQIRGVEFIAMNTDAQHLETTEAPVRIQLGEHLTHGLGAGGDPAVGRKAAEETHDQIKQILEGADMVFITAGMGGGTGTGSAPVVAEIAKQSGALTIAMVTRPFSFEGTRRNRVANEGIASLIGKADTVIAIHNQRLLQVADQKTSLDSAFRMADEVLFHGVQAIAEIITNPGLINIDFASVCTVMKGAGPAWMSIGYGSGPNRAVDAAKAALARPLVDISIEAAERALFRVVGGSGLALSEVKDAAEVIRQAIDPEANVFFGVVLDPKMGEAVRLTLIAAGFPTVESQP